MVLTSAVLYTCTVEFVVLYTTTVYNPYRTIVKHNARLHSKISQGMGGKTNLITRQGRCTNLHGTRRKEQARDQAQNSRDQMQDARDRARALIDADTSHRLLAQDDGRRDFGAAG